MSTACAQAIQHFGGAGGMRADHFAALVAGADRSTLTTIAAAVQDTGLPVLAAGVESDAGLDLARELGFEWTQGFHLGEPVGPDGALGGPLALRER